MIIRDVILEIEGITLSGQFYLPDNEARYPAVCLCHGIPSGKPPDQGDGGYPSLAEKICREGFAVLIFNFRGAGNSGGNIDIMGWTRDLGVAIDFLLGLPEVNKSPLSLVGFSGGAAVAIYVASQDRRVSSVAACACPAEFTFFTEANEPQSVVDHYRSIGAIRDTGFPASIDEWYKGFRLMKPLEYIAGITPRPLLLVHGSRDETVPLSHARRLFDEAGQPKQIAVIEGAGHRLRQDEKAMSVVLSWLKSNCHN